ncbi:serine/threonine-protein kinase [Micromonospora noduli]|uniref:non-specific serine/threonine protein kinase n=1 Tax=Micromonospora noduli TaxID=709876 RepID=A0ABX9D6M4_9ACTN|nr:serine/threonine-protein kinase [Micromonospora noduli]RAO23499.1 Non-specific serine/threonine protein kinase [Micromonospora noduli]RAO40701.1 Non-specific serine/threonine protein kinase [Micromonospora noduli]
MQRDQLLAGRYRLLERLGSGGMSAVHRAYDEVLERDVAVKVLVASDTNARQRIRGEAKAAARLSHPHVTGVYDYGESVLDGAQVPFVVMELLGGHTLEHRLVVGPLPPRPGLRVCAEVASALTAAHEQGLVHRDIKPGNVMLTPTGAKVLDFGIAAAAGAPEIDFEGRLLGTPAYLAPERLLAGEVLPASDVYALGLLLYRVLTGRLPWPAETQTGMLRVHTLVEPDPLPPIDGVPPEVHRLYRWCLAGDPADRPSAADAARILLAAASGAAPEAAAAASAANVAESTGPGSTGATTTAAPTGTGSTGTEPARAGPTGTGQTGAGPTRDSAARMRRGPWRRRRAILTVGGAVIAAVALAGSLGDFSNRRQGQIEAPTGSGPGTTTVGMPRTEESTDAADAGPTAVPPTRNTAPATRISPPAAPGGTLVPGPTSPTSDPTPTAPTPTAAAAVPVDARGGTVTARCVGRSVEVLTVVLAPDFRVEGYDPGPAKQIVVELTSAEHRSEIRVQCPNGQMQSKVKERAV